MLAKMFYRAGPDKISPQDNEEESQGIRFIRDDAGRQARVGMSTGITDIPWYSNCAAFLRLPIPFHQISIIVCKKSQSSFGRTVWAGVAGSQRHPGCILKPLPV